MGRSCLLRVCTVFCTVLCAAHVGSAQAVCWTNSAPRTAYAAPTPPPYPTVLTYYQPGAVPSVQPQPTFCNQCGPQVVQQPIVQQQVVQLPVPPPQIVYRPILPLAPQPESYYTGQGVLGQPKLYVPGQPIRNFLRYLGP